jgi:peptidoglycan/xylan/chitin deacetylase (PgdA/CDA1 family)
MTAKKHLILRTGCEAAADITGKTANIGGEKSALNVTDKKRPPPSAADKKKPILKKFKIPEKVFVNIVANVIMVLIVTTILALSFGSEFLIAINGNASQAIYRGNVTKKNVSIMINVYFGTEYIERMLQILREYDAIATFFVGGVWVNKNNDALKLIAESGHEIGNHGYFHLDHKSISYAKNKEEILVTEKLVESVIGKKTNLFAPPDGSFNATTLKAANELGYKTVVWSKDTIDRRDKNTELIYTRAVKELKNGDLISMHPTANTVEALKDICKYFAAQGFNMVSVSDNIA